MIKPTAFSAYCDKNCELKCISKRYASLKSLVFTIWWLKKLAHFCSLSTKFYFNFCQAEVAQLVKRPSKVLGHGATLLTRAQNTPRRWELGKILAAPYDEWRPQIRIYVRGLER